MICVPFPGIAIRYQQARGKFPHRIDCVPERDARDDDLMVVLRRMKEATALDGLKENHDYRWIGLSTAAFRNKGRAAVMVLELSP